MATVATLDLLLRLKDTGFSQEMAQALNHVKDFDKEVDRMGSTYRASASQVSRAMREVIGAEQAAQAAKKVAAAEDVRQKRGAFKLNERLERENARTFRQMEKERAAVQRQQTREAAERARRPGLFGPGGTTRRIGGMGLAPFSAGLSVARAALRQFSVNLSGVYTHLGPFSARVGAGTALLLGLGGGLVAIGKSAVQTAVEFERTEIAFEVMTGSAERAKAVLEDLYQFAAVTPFEIQDVIKAAQTFTAVGIEAETAAAMVKRLGNISASMPGEMADNLQHVVRALAQMHAKGTVQAEEMTRQLANAGIPAWEALAHRIGVTVPEAMARARAGMVSAREGIMAILDLAASPRFAGAQARHAQTMIGLWSTLKDNVTFFMRDLGQIIIRGFDLKGAAAELTGFFGALRGHLTDLGPVILRVGAVFRASFSVVLDLLKNAAEAIAGWTKTLDNSQHSVLRWKLFILTSLESLVVGLVQVGNRIQIVVGEGLQGLAQGLKVITTAFHLAAIAALAYGHAQAIAFGAKGGPLGALAAAAAYTLIADPVLGVMQAGTNAAKAAFDLMSREGALLAGIDPNQNVQNVNKFFQDMRATAVAQGEVAKGARLVAAGFLPMGHVIQGATNNLVQFNAAAGKIDFPRRFGEMGPQMMAGIKEMAGDFGKLQERIADARIVLADLRKELDVAAAPSPFKKMADGAWGLVAPLKQVAAAFRNVPEEARGAENPMQRSFDKVIGKQRDRIARLDGERARVQSTLNDRLRIGPPENDPLLQFLQRKNNALEAEMVKEGRLLDVLLHNRAVMPAWLNPEQQGGGAPLWNLLGGGAFGALSLPWKDVEKFGAAVQDAFKKAAGPLDDLMGKVRNLMQGEVRGLGVGLAGPVADMGLMIADGLHVGLQNGIDKARLAARAQFVNIGRDFQALQQKYLGNMKDTPALVSGSAEATNAINKAMNEQQRSGQQDTKAIWVAIQKLVEEENKKLEKIGREVEGLREGAKKLGVG